MDINDFKKELTSILLDNIKIQNVELSGSEEHGLTGVNITIDKITTLTESYLKETSNVELIDALHSLKNRLVTVIFSVNELISLLQKNNINNN